MTRRILVVAVATAVLALTFAAAAPRALATVGFVDKQVEAGGLLLQNYVNTYGMTHGFVFPAPSMLKKGGGLQDATRIWPSNPWTGKVMGPGTSRGTYTYALRNAGTAYSLTMHLSGGKYVFSGTMPAWMKTERDQESKQSLLLLQRYVEATAASSHLYPATGAFTNGTYAAAVWPADPWTGQPMALGTGVGDYSYTQKNGGTGYELKTTLSDRKSFVLLQSPVSALLTAPPN